jgi:vancomycin resistance protein YoaR
LGIKTLVSEATSYFKGSNQGRMHNIALAASKFDGVIIPPGEIFSFNEHLGEVSKENGYDESMIIFGDRTSIGIGGGICQVSTTVFRAAFFGGFELVERWAHGYRVGWYEINSTVGLDATVYTPDVDFKFRNDTDHFLLIRTNSDLVEGTVTFKFFGTPTEREVIVSEPEITNVVKHAPPLYEKDPTLADGVVKQVDWSNDGMDVSVTRLVKKGDEVVHDDEIFSQYKPWRAVYKVGTRREEPAN